MIRLKINNIEYKSREPKTILAFCKEQHIHIPSLCYHPDLDVKGLCRVCVVEIEGRRLLEPACSTIIEDGMRIHTSSPKVRKARRDIVELLLANHYTDCTVCARNLNCELQALANEYKIESLRWQEKRVRTLPLDDSSPAFIRDNNKCVLCQRCVRACDQLQSVYAIGTLYKGEKTSIGSAFDSKISDVVCINCGQCVAHCPTGALVERSHIQEVWDAIDDPEKVVVVQTAPAIRAALGEAFGLPAGSLVTGQMVSALKQIGFNYVFDTQFTADLTIIEEGYELLARLKESTQGKNARPLPMMTSCSPGWIKFQEHFFPDLLPNLSSCKSPQQMFGSLLKTYWADKSNIDPEKIVSVSVMPCTAKKFEAGRPEMWDSGYSDVDYSITTRELAAMIKQAGMHLPDLPESYFDNPLGNSSGAAVIFGSTGGVMEAALRTAYELITGDEVPFDHLDITPVRGFGGIREAVIPINKTVDEWSFLKGSELKIAVAHGTANAKTLMELVVSGKAEYHFIEIMTCPGGCLGGGGQPIPVDMDIRKARAEAIYKEDSSMQYRKSHENPAVKELYADFLGKPNSELAHKLLHTHYKWRGVY